MSERAISARLEPYILDGSKSIIVSITSSGSVMEKDVCPEAVGIGSTLS
jgi:hypothetical protein